MNTQSPYAAARKAAQRQVDEQAYLLRTHDLLTLREVAERMGCTIASASKRCARHEARALKHLGDETGKVKQRLTRQAERVLSSVWEDYQKDRCPKRAEVVLKCIDRIARVWGLHAPTPLPHQTNIQVNQQPTLHLTTEQLLALVNTLPPAPLPHAPIYKETTALNPAPDPLPQPTALTPDPTCSNDPPPV